MNVRAPAGYAAIITAAGRGSRAGGAIPKQWRELAGRTVLARAIAALPGRKIVHTNADSAYAARVLSARGLDVFEAVFGVEETHFHPKPDPRAYEAVIDMAGIDPARAVFFEDDPRNLRVPHRLGMRTVLVGPGRHGPNDSAPEAEIGDHVDHRICDLEAFLCRIAPRQPPGQNGGRDRNVRGRRCR